MELIVILKALVEVALLALLGQGIVYLLAGASRENNFVYQLFRIITKPPVRLVRLITPKFVIDRHVAVLTFFLLLWVWLLLVYAKGQALRSMAAG
jgi:hypothetical protein